MSHPSLFRRGGFLLLLTVLLFSLTLPAQALFNHDDRASGDSPLPIAENLSLTTYKNVAVTGTLSAVDPEGDPVIFRVTKNPARGELTFGEEGGAKFTYTPYENKLGKDSFEYVAEDSQGNVSQPAIVSIRISKADTKVTYPSQTLGGGYADAQAGEGAGAFGHGHQVHVLHGEAAAPQKLLGHGQQGLAVGEAGVSEGLADEGLILAQGHGGGHGGGLQG